MQWRLLGCACRWKQNLIAKCVSAGRPFDDASISPVVRQTLLHWGYQLTKQDYGAWILDT